jgi:oxygen-independent coproporphyrinogen III oxidase
VFRPTDVSRGEKSAAVTNGRLIQERSNVPRYTSYPTAPHFHSGIGSGQYRDWLSELGTKSTLSLYVHIPFCDRLCWFCGCTTKQTLRYDPVTTYLDFLKREIDKVGELTRNGPTVTRLHFGGGSPTMLQPDDLIALGSHLRSAFRFSEDAEICVEIDPNDMDETRLDALAGIGLTRASLGVQDFDPGVQETINRIQTFDTTRHVVDSLRARGVHSLNLDLLYGLPRQTCETLASSIEQALQLDADRLALFGYAHVPWMKKHQTLIDESLLPGHEERIEQSTLAARMLRCAGYASIGIDHFAKPDDDLAIAAKDGYLHRNFQGYTDDTASALIGLGASSISQLPQGYVQNSPATGDYQRRIENDGLAVVRGVALSPEDRMRAWVIERLMCAFEFSREELRRRFGPLSAEVDAEASKLADLENGEIFEQLTDRFRITESGRPYARLVASRFDTYLSNGAARHSAAV